MSPWFTTFVAAGWPLVRRAGVSEEHRGLAQKIRWLLLLRVVIVSFFLGATALFHFVRTEGNLGYLVDLSIPLILAYVISLGSVALLPYTRGLRLFAHAQVGFDVVLITGIIWITGDMTSPFSVLYNLAVMNGAILLFYRGAFFAAAFSGMSYASLLIWSRYANSGADLPLSWPTLFPIVQSIASYFIIAGLSGFLTNKLSETEKLLKEKQERLSRLGRAQRTLFSRASAAEWPLQIRKGESTISTAKRRRLRLWTKPRSGANGWIKFSPT